MSKPLRRPRWATPESLIGYTFRMDLNPHVLRNFELFVGLSPLDSYPSVYYTDGHATVDHKDPDNIGWTDSRHWKCLFFGNVTYDMRHKRPHGADRNQKGKAYAAELASRFPNYWLGDVWAPRMEPQYPTARTLLEVWETAPGEIHIHASRNRFRWIADQPETRSLLHDLGGKRYIMSADRLNAGRMKQLPKKPLVTNP